MALIASKALQKRKAPFLPDIILEQLKCNECLGYLSTPPILKHIDGRSICGACAPYTPTESYTRNTEYEAIASFVEFPCKNKGCHLRILFGKYLTHEYECVFRQYDCPVPLCAWQGCAQELGTHFAKKHANFYLNNISFTPEIRKNCEQILLHLFDNKLFIVQTKCVVLQCRLWVLIRYIGKPKTAGLFKFTLEFRGNATKKSYFTDEMLMQSDLCWIMDTNNALEINISNLLKELNCPLAFKCKIHIKRINT